MRTERRLIDDLRTERLQLTRLCADDLLDLVRMHADERVMATLAGVRSEAETAAMLDRLMAHWDAHGFGYWLARDLETGRFAGRGGLRRVEIDGRDEVEVGYGLMSEFWGRGLASEMARESVRVAFDLLEFDELVCFTLPTNRASQAVMQKVGFRYERDFVWAELPHVLHRLRADDWRRHAP